MDGDRPKRMYDCLAGLEVIRWFEAVSAHTVSRDLKSSATISLWNHSQSIAHYARLIAQSLVGISPEDAYLVGLLHEIRTIPMVLGWGNALPNTEAFGDVMAVERSLPLFVLAALRCVKRSNSRSIWRLILSEAHLLSDAEEDPLNHCGAQRVAGKDASAFENDCCLSTGVGARWRAEDPISGAICLEKSAERI
jgi:hypothetical protein